VYCPRCQDEFRSGFTRCERCGVELVHELSREEPRVAPPPVPVAVADYCGFFTLDEARQARDQLRVRHIVTDIVIREPFGATPDEPLREEYWLRVDSKRYREAHAILGEPKESIAAAAAEDDSFACSECGDRVAAHERFCPGCGARFEES
jgi:hypothetical protein